MLRQGAEAEEGEMDDNGDFVVLFSGLTGLAEELGEKWRREPWYRDVYQYLTEGGAVPEGLDSLGQRTFKIEADNFRVVDGELS